MPDIIDISEIRERRVIAEIEEDETDWWELRTNVLEVFSRSNISNQALVSAGLRAILDILKANEIPLNEAKKCIASTLRAFR